MYGAWIRFHITLKDNFGVDGCTNDLRWDMDYWMNWKTIELYIENFI